MSDEMTKVVQSQGFCCQQDDVPTAFPAPEELEAEDEVVRGHAFEVVSETLLTYMRTPSPERLIPMLPTMDRFLEISEFEANLVTFADINVADGATFVISDDTHLVEANKVVMEGSGTIKCRGFTKLKVESIEQI